MLNYFEKLGADTLYHLNQTGRMGIFLFYSLLSIIRPPYKIFPIIKQTYVIGALSIFVIIFTGAFSGMVLGLQGYHTLSKFGAEGLLGSAVALSLIRELGPVLAALMVTGRAGSAICAEIGIMRISEQVDALECMAIDPHKYIIAPKFIAGIISLPLLTAIFDVTGIMGGYLVGVGMLGGNAGTYFSSMYKDVEFSDIYMGLVKSLCFGVLIIWICASKGYYVHLNRGGGFGAEGVSSATTNAVVLSSVSILLFDYFLTSVLL
ncbi:MAG TPA: ABC transporter permease [Nitrospirae bacterium]|nr:putative phospholipid ABC transporter permease protein MlaE [bacterium BMS3Abin06]HDH11873.1 ABC transporter permease [Nitrospirota bacterium]HDZ02785.1 ABC transporter permease [Nitrospirota bacterium]